jgi:hypothetical protein
MQDNILFLGNVAGDDEDYYLKAKVAPMALQTKRRVSSYDLLAVMLHESERQTPQQQKQAVTRMWCEYIAPSFESSEVLYINFNASKNNKGEKGEKPVLKLKQAFQLLLRIPSTQSVNLHRGPVAQVMAIFFADNEPSVAE